MMSIVGSILQTGDHADLMIKSGGPALTVPTLHKRQTWRLRCKGSVSQGSDGRGGDKWRIAVVSSRCAPGEPYGTT